MCDVLFSLYWKWVAYQNRRILAGTKLKYSTNYLIHIFNLEEKDDFIKIYIYIYTSPSLFQSINPSREVTLVKEFVLLYKITNLNKYFIMMKYDVFYIRLS